jgi:TRAP-type C4-dicarboxylate transport system substrate-binding protein
VNKRLNVRLKNLLTLLSFIIIGTILVACGDSTSSTTEPKETEGNETEGNENEEMKTYTLRMTSAYPASEPGVADGKALSSSILAEEIEKRTNGRVKIEIFYSNQLVPQDQALDAVKNGTVELAQTTGYWGDKLPTNDLFFLPYNFLGAEHFYHVMRNTEAGELFEKEFEEYGAKVLMYWSSGSQGIISKTPIESIDDMEGMTIRLASSLAEPWFNEIGAAPANVAATEQYQALSQGILDGTIYAFNSAFKSYKLHEVTNYVVTPGFYDPIGGVILIDLDTWNEFPKEIQDTITEVVSELEARIQDNLQKEFEEAMQTARDHGMTIHELSPEELKRFQESTQVIYDEFAAQNENTKRVVEILRETQEEFR